MRLNLNDIKIEDVIKSKTISKGLVGLIILGGLTLSSCSDDKSCTDYDRSADGNGSTAYDVGLYQDAYDYGGDTDTGSGDQAGRGSRCSDYD